MAQNPEKTDTVVDASESSGGLHHLGCIKQPFKSTGETTARISEASSSECRDGRKATLLTSLEFSLCRPTAAHFLDRQGKGWWNFLGVTSRKSNIDTKKWWCF